MRGGPRVAGQSGDRRCNGRQGPTAPSLAHRRRRQRGAARPSSAPSAPAAAGRRSVCTHPHSVLCQANTIATMRRTEENRFEPHVGAAARRCGRRLPAPPTGSCLLASLASHVPCVVYTRSMLLQDSSFVYFWLYSRACLQVRAGPRSLTGRRRQPQPSGCGGRPQRPQLQAGKARAWSSGISPPAGRCPSGTILSCGAGPGSPTHCRAMLGSATPPACALAMAGCPGTSQRRPRAGAGGGRAPP